jgi:hypothetical protein
MARFVPQSRRAKWFSALSATAVAATALLLRRHWPKQA